MILVLPDPAGAYYSREARDGKRAIDFVYFFNKPQFALDVHPVVKVARFLGVEGKSIRVVRNYKELK